jgi:predicted polyphosphate/ATP-dependent NAD kinase
MVSKIGLIVNPIAGMGGKVGLKGTDGVIEKAIELGAKPIASQKTVEMLKEFFANYSINSDIQWFTSKGDMGGNQLVKTGIKEIQIIYEPSVNYTTSEDTKNACKCLLEIDIDLLLFCGGDGTARDIFEIVDQKIPILGIPSGVKMHSAVFGINVSATAKMLFEFTQGTCTIGDADIMDLDEDRYRSGEWNIQLFGVARGIVEPTYIQVGKICFESVSDDVIKDELTEHIIDEIEQNNNFLYLFGSGGTIDYITTKMNIKNTLLGIDAVYNKKLIGKDVNEEQILKLLKRYPKVKIILSPIGAQGFILGRGNLQLSPTVIKKIGLNNIIVISTPSKLINTPVIRVDTGDKKLDQMFVKLEFFMVVIGYRLSKVVKIQS